MDCDSAGHPTNLIMHTEHHMAWYGATLQHYPSAKKSGNRATMGLKIGTEENQITVTAFHTGTVLVKWNYSAFERDFSTIKPSALSLFQSSSTPDLNDSTPEVNDPPSREPFWAEEMKELKDRFSKLEVMQVQLEHLINSRTTPTSSPGDEEERMLALWTEVRKLQEDHNKSLADKEVLKQEVQREREEKEAFKQMYNQLQKEVEDLRGELRAQLPSMEP